MISGVDLRSPHCFGSGDTHLAKLGNFLEKAIGNARRSVVSMDQDGEPAQADFICHVWPLGNLEPTVEVILVRQGGAAPGDDA